MTSIRLIGNFSEAAHQLLTATPGVKVTVGLDFVIPLQTLPELLVMEFSGEYEGALHSLTKIPIERRPALIAIIPNEDVTLVRQAMHAGARDYLVQPLDVNSLQTMIETFLRESETSLQQSPGATTAIISATSNADSAYVTANLAQITAECGKQTTSILDLDFQFSSLPVMLDIEPERSLLQAIDVIDTLDEVALNAYLTKHASGLKILCSFANDIALPGEVAVDHIRQIASMAGQASQSLFINLPHIVDPLNSQVIDDADHVLVCVEQSFASLNFAKGLVNVLLKELDQPTHKIILLVNRYWNKHKISQADIEKTLGIKPTIILPPDSRELRDAERYGLLLQDTANQTLIYKNLLQLAERLSGTQFNVGKSLINRIMARIEGKHAW